MISKTEKKQKRDKLAEILSVLVETIQFCVCTLLRKGGVPA